MQFTNGWNTCNLHRYTVIAVVILMISTLESKTQPRWTQGNNPNYDNKRLSYGFLIGLHSSTFQIKYSDRFVTPDLDTVSAVLPSWSQGFSLGFIMNCRLAEFFDLRLIPIEVAFYENRLRYQFINGPPVDESVENTIVESSILLKYKSERRGNIRMYMIGGVKPGIEATGKKNIDQTKPSLEVKGIHLNLEAGFGFDLYYPLFKFSPEIRFSRGIVDILDNKINEFGQPLQRVNTNKITLYLLFQ